MIAVFFFFINSFPPPPPQIVLNKITEVKHLQCYLKEKPKESGVFHALPLGSAWNRTVDFIVLFNIYALLMIH